MQSREAHTLIRCNAIQFAAAAGHVLYANATAERLLAAGGGLFVGGKGLAAWTPVQTGRLAAAIARAVQGYDGGAMRLERQRSDQPLYALATPLPVESAWMHPRGGRVLLLVCDPQPQPVLSEGHVSVLFGLTPAEARVTLRLYRGESPTAIAAALGISRHTARVHVNVVLRKCGAHRQAELIRRLTVFAELADHHHRPKW